MNLAVLKFLLHFPPPATTAELWAEIAFMRTYDAAADLPNTFDALQAALESLERAGRVVRGDGGWDRGGLVDVTVKQGALFA